MKFKPNTLSLTPEQLERQYQNAVDLGSVRAGEVCLFYPKLGQTECLPYENLVQIYLRKEECITRLCCGTADLSPVFVMAVEAGGKVRKTQIRNQDMGKTLLDYVARQAPHVKIGFTKD